MWSKSRGWLDDITAAEPQTVIGRKWVSAAGDSYDSGVSSTTSSISGSTEDIFSWSRDHCRFRLVTYNILTDNCIRSGEYLYCPEQYRYMTSRHVFIMAEIQEMAPDVICFQEVDHAHYKSRLSVSMRELGYEGILLQRRDDQGLATFWKCSDFVLEQQKHATLHDLAETYLQMSDLCPSELSMVREAIERPEALLIVRLRHINTNIQLAVANIHVTWSQLKYPALQALQVSMGVHGLGEFVKGVEHCAQIICGDFNSPPGSLPYQLLSRGHLDDVMVTCLEEKCTFEDKVERLRAVDLLNVLPRSAFNIKSRLRSAYKAVTGCEPEITNCDEAASDYLCKLCLDYIWFNAHSLEVAAVLQTPPTESVTKYYGLPSVDYPSDHIPLLAEFILR